MIAKHLSWIRNLGTLCLLLGIPTPGFSQIPVTGLADKTVYVDQATFSVLNEAGNASSGVYAYDPSSDSWSQKADLPEDISAASAAVLDGQLYVVGGCTTGNCAPTSTKVYRYDAGSDSWTAVADYPEKVAFTPTRRPRTPTPTTPAATAGPRSRTFLQTCGRPRRAVPATSCRCPAAWSTTASR